MNIRIIEGVACERVPSGAPIRETDWVYGSGPQAQRAGKSMVGKPVNGRRTYWRRQLKRAEVDSGLRTVEITTQIELEATMSNNQLRDYLDKRLNTGNGVFFRAAQSQLKITEVETKPRKY